jgi:mannosyltransferase
MNARRYSRAYRTINERGVHAGQRRRPELCGIRSGIGMCTLGLPKRLAVKLICSVLHRGGTSAGKGDAGSSLAGAAVAALTLLAVIVRWPTLAGPSFWVDEWVTRQIVSQHPLDVLPAIKAGESTPPLYYTLAWGWTQLFGSSEVALRFLSVLLGAATVPVAYAAATVLASRRAGLIAASFVAVNPLLVWYSTEARAYSLFVLLGALSFLFFAQTLVHPTTWSLALWSLTGAALLTAHYFGAFLLAAELLVLLALQRSDRRGIYIALAPIAATGAALLPLVYWQRGNPDWIQDLSLTTRLAEVARNFAVGVSEPRAWLGLVVALLVSAAFLLLVRAEQRDRRAAATAFAVGALTLFLPLLAAAVGDYVLTRNLLVAWVPLAVAVAIACGPRRAGGAGLFVASALCIAWLAAVVNVASDSRLQRADWQQAARLIGEAPRDRLVLAWAEWGASPLGDELPGARRFVPGDAARVAEIALLGTASPAGRSCWSGAACNLSHVQPGSDPPIAGFSFVGAERDGLFQVLRFRAAEPVRLTWGQVSKVEPRHGAPAIWLQPVGAEHVQ